MEVRFRGVSVTEASRSSAAVFRILISVPVSHAINASSNPAQGGSSRTKGVSWGWPSCRRQNSQLSSLLVVWACLGVSRPWCSSEPHYIKQAFRGLCFCVYVEFDVSVMDRNLRRCVREQGAEPAWGLAERGTCRDSTGTWTRPSVGRPPETDSAGGETDRKHYISSYIMQPNTNTATTLQHEIENIWRRRTSRSPISIM